MLFEMMIQTHCGYDDLLCMTTGEINEFFEYLRERETGTAKLTDMQKMMIEENKKERKRMGLK